MPGQVMRARLASPTCLHRKNGWNVLKSCASLAGWRRPKPAWMSSAGATPVMPCPKRFRIGFDLATNNHVPDPRPVPPQPLEEGACCQGGCSRCVLEIHEEAWERYRLELSAWECRNPENGA